MSTIAETPSLASSGITGWVPSPLYRMSLEHYEAMIESGVFSALSSMESNAARYRLLTPCPEFPA